MWIWEKKCLTRVLVFDLSCELGYVTLFEKQGTDCHLIYKKELDFDPFVLQQTDLDQYLGDVHSNTCHIRVILPDEIVLTDSIPWSREIGFRQQYQILKFKLLDIARAHECQVCFCAIQDDRVLSAFMVQSHLIHTLEESFSGCSHYLDMICVHRQLAKKVVGDLPDARAQWMASLSPYSPLVANFIDWRKQRRGARINKEIRLFCVSVIAITVVVLGINAGLEQRLAQYMRTVEVIEQQIVERKKDLIDKDAIYIQLGELYKRWGYWRERQQNLAHYIENWGVLEDMNSPNLRIKDLQLSAEKIQLESVFSSHQEMTDFVDRLVEKEARGLVQIVSVKKTDEGVISRLDIQRDIRERDNARQ